MSPRGDAPTPAVERQPLWWLTGAGVAALGVEAVGAALGTDAGRILAGVGLMALCAMGTVYAALYQARGGRKG